VPLSKRALEILETLPREGEHVFGGARAGKPLSQMALLMTFRGMATASPRTALGRLSATGRPSAVVPVRQAG
jgi:hypothetical protein